MQSGISIGKVFGVPLKLHYSWFIVFALVTWSLAASYYPSVYPAWTMPMKISAGLITSLLFFGSVLFHELMHCIVARSEGIPIRGITLFILGGVSEITDEPKTAKDEFRMAIAGPASSLVLGGVFWGLWFLLRDLSLASLEYIAAISYWLGYINLALGVFNLIPGFPLDGGRVFRSLLWWRNKKVHRATRIASNLGRIIGFLFILGGIYLIFTNNWMNGIWFALIGWFLQSSAAGSYQQSLFEDMLKGHIASEIMSHDCQTVAPNLRIQQLVDENILASGRRCFIVAEENRIKGMVTIVDVKKVPREGWKAKTVLDVMTPLDKLKSVKPDEDLNTVFKTLVQNNINQVPVVEGQNIKGMVARDAILNFVNLRSQLN